MMRQFLRVLVACLLIGLVPSLVTTASAGGCDGSGSPGADFIDVGVVCHQPGDSDTGWPTPPVDTSGNESSYVKYMWGPMCSFNPNAPLSDNTCLAASTCTNPDERRFQLWAQLPGGTWELIGSECWGDDPPKRREPPQVTPAMVLDEIRRVGLPTLSTEVQPEGRTLVNFDTIFFTDPQPVDLDLTMLGQAVQVEASASRYRWVFGDGTTITTDSPGAPYPSKEVVHRYADADVTVRPHVETVYTARFRVNGGDWQEIGETVTTVGPATELRIVEGTPLLTASAR